MKFVALLSGGKDSVYNVLECVSLGHELVCVANLFPKKKENENQEKDSYMYQTVGVETVPFIAQCL
jgi:diphthine-ammonia ligase